MADRQKVYDEYDRILEKHWARIAELQKLPLDEVIMCEICDGKAPEPEFCGCGGTMTVSEAIHHHEFEIDMIWFH